MTFTLIEADCIDAMAGLEPDSVDAIVTDPPYGLEFMGKGWDAFRLDDPGTSRHRGEAAGDHGELQDRDGTTLGGRLRVGYGGTGRAKTSRCAGCGRRDQFRNAHEPCGAGTWRPELIDPHAAPPTMLAFGEWSRTWATQALRVLKPGGHLLAFGGTRTYHRLVCGLEDAGFEIRDCLAWLYGSGFPKSLDVAKAIDKAAGALQHEAHGFTVAGRTDKNLPNPVVKGYEPPAPVTAAAQQWAGWGTALKPAFEPIVLARKPLSEANIAANVQRWGTGALNIDATRIEAGPEYHELEVTQGGSHSNVPLAPDRATPRVFEVNEAGRWPANVTLDETAAAMLDEQTGEIATPRAVRAIPQGDSGFMHSARPVGEIAGYGDTGGASRFFYCPKADREERNRGVYTAAAQVYGPGTLPGSLSGPMANTHPTVKPVELMRWLCRMVTPPAGTVLDPFTGSGSTGVAALREGFRFVGIEREPDYLEIARSRIYGDAPLFNVEAPA